MKMMVSPLQISSSSYGVGAIVLSQSPVAAFISPSLTKMAMAGPAPPLVSCSFSRQVAALHDVAAVDDSPTTTTTNEEKEKEEDEDGDGDGGGRRITVVKVPRPRYISVSKSQLLNAIVSTIFFDSQLKADQFIRLSKCLDTIIHAEHKCILEEMRLNYDLTNDEEGEVHRTEHFQHSFVQLLYNAEFEELSAMDLLLTSSLNTDYLLTLPINVDWKKAAQSNAIIYRRGYTTEKQKGLLTVEKLDYLQSKLLQRIFLLIAKPLGNFGIWLTEVLGSTTRQKQGKLVWAEGVKLWLEKLLPLFQQSSYSYDEFTSSKQVEGVDPLIGSADLPIWLAAQRAVTRYEGILSAIGPRERLLRKLLVWIGVSPPTPPQPAFDLKTNTNNGSDDAESFSRPISLPRVSLTDIWEPASRKYCGNDLWKMFKTFISILLSQSTLQEPAFKELILLYSTDLDGADTEDTAAVPSLELKIYEKIPIPDLPVIFPHKKLSFRIIDTVRLDAATILGLLAYFINYKFENISSSPSAIVLDIIAVTALVIYVTRVVLGYKQTRDRYQLLVNRTLYEKTVASGFGSVHFLLDASEQQLYKEAILAYAIILKAGNDKVTARSAGDECEKFIFNVFNQKIEMPIDKATNTLSRLGLVTEKVVDKEVVLEAIPCSQAYEILRQRWNYLLN